MRLLRPTIAPAALALCAVAASSAGAAWSPPQELGAAHPSEPQIVIDGNARGDTTLAWTGRTGLDVATAPAGEGFAVRGTVASPHVDQLAAPVVGARDGAPTLAWLADPRDCGELTCTSVMTVRCGALACPARPSRPVGKTFAINPELDLGPRGRALVWWEGLEGNAGVLARRPGRFGPVRRLPGGGYFDGRTFAFDRRGGGELVWTDGRRIRSLRLRADGRRARRRTIGATPGYDSAIGARIAGDPDVGHVIAWASRGDRGVGLNVATRPRRGRFGRARRVGSASEPPALAVSPSGAAVVAWAAEGARTGEIHAVVRRPGGGFGARRTIRAPVPGEAPRLLNAAVGAAGRAVVAWVTGEESQPASLWAATLDPRPSAPVRLATLQRAPAPQLALDARGRGWAAWLDDGRVFVARLTA